MWRLAEVNLAIRNIDAKIGHGDTLNNDARPDLEADCVFDNGSMMSNHSGECEICAVQYSYAEETGVEGIL